MSKYSLKEGMYRLLDRLAAETIKYTRALKSGDSKEQLREQANAINQIIARIEDERSSGRQNLHG